MKLYNLHATEEAETSRDANSMNATQLPRSLFGFQSICLCVFGMRLWFAVEYYFALKREHLLRKFMMIVFTVLFIVFLCPLSYTDFLSQKSNFFLICDCFPLDA